jgi:hypothetical protein
MRKPVGLRKPGFHALADGGRSDRLRPAKIGNDRFCDGIGLRIQLTF